MNDWTLEWYHFADIYCFSSGGAGGALVDNLLEVSKEDLSSVFTDDNGSDVNSLMSRLNAVAKEWSNNEWREWPADLKVGVRKMPEELEGELILTPSAVFIPWPLPISDWVRKKQLEEHLKDVEINVFHLNEQSSEYDSARDLRVRPFITVVDNFLMSGSTDVDEYYRNQLRGCNDSYCIETKIKEYAAILMGDAIHCPMPEMNLAVEEGPIYDTEFSALNDNLNLVIRIPDEATLGNETPEWPCGNLL